MLKLSVHSCKRLCWLFRSATGAPRREAQLFSHMILQWYWRQYGARGLLYHCLIFFKKGALLSCNKFLGWPPEWRGKRAADQEVDKFITLGFSQIWPLSSFPYDTYAEQPCLEQDYVFSSPSALSKSFWVHLPFPPTKSKFILIIDRWEVTCVIPNPRSYLPTREIFMSLPIHSLHFAASFRQNSSLLHQKII